MVATTGARAADDADEGAGSSTDAGRLPLAERLSELARDLQETHDVDATLRAIVDAAVGTVPGAQHASISSIHRRREVRTRASTSDLPSAIDRAQSEAGEGPCLDTVHEHRTVQVPDLAAELRWPQFARRAHALGAGSMLVVQLFVEGDDLGALNLSSEQAGAFDDDSEHVALLVAAHAAVAMSDAQEHARLTDALGRRDLVGQAKGILMERFKITGDQAFTLLVRASQHTNRKLHHIADELASTGELPSA